LAPTIFNLLGVPADNSHDPSGLDFISILMRYISLAALIGVADPILDIRASSPG